MESVSIIIPVYRQARFLRRAITSVLEQDYGNFEIVVVDDGSLDASNVVSLEFQSMDPRVRTLVRRENGGLGRARNSGLAAARGDYVGFLDSDDYLLPGAITERVKALRATDDPAVVGAYGDWVHVQEHIDRPSPVRAARANMPVIDATTYNGFNGFIVTSPLVDRHAAIEAGGFGDGLPMLEDWVLWLRMLARGGRFVPVEHVVCVYRQRPGSMLRTSGATLPAAARMMNMWWLDQGHHLSDGGRARAWLDARPSLAHHRRNWTAASSEGLDLFPRAFAGTSHQFADDPVVPAITDALQQNASSVESTTDEVVFGERIGSVAQLTTAERHVPSFDWVLAPTDLEGGLEAAVLCQYLRAAGHEVAIGVTGRQRLTGLWPALRPGVPVVLLGSPACDDARFIVWAPEDDLAVRLARRHGKQRVVARPTGVGVFSIMRRGGQLRFRAPGKVLFRTRLEVVEYGDRPHAVLASGARHGLHTRQAAPEYTVVVPDELLRYPALDGWTASATRAAAAVHADVRIVGSHLVAARLAQLRIEPFEIDVLRGRAVLPVTNLITLAQAVGGSPIVFGPSVDRTVVSQAWLAGLDLAVDEQQLVETLSSPAERLSPSIGSVEPTDLTADDWASQFIAAVNVE